MGDLSASKKHACIPAGNVSASKSHNKALEIPREVMKNRSNKNAIYVTYLTCSFSLL